MAEKDRHLEIVPDAPADPVAGIDASVAHQARVYNYWLGGQDNYLADWEAAEQAIRDFPGIVRGVRAQRAFLGKAVRCLAGPAGIRQFLDIGTGIPTADNTHEVAQAVAPESRVVYADNDLMVLATRPPRCARSPAAPGSPPAAPTTTSAPRRS